jgi:hypothetical protein
VPKEELNETYLKRRVKETGGITRKVKWVAVRGAPDRLVMWPARGRHCYVELKEESQPWGLQDHQRREIDRMKRAGMRVAILENKKQIDDFIAWHMHEC